MRQELDEIHRSKLWKLGTLYRHYVGNALSHR
jgi:hypothetical protein